MSAYAEFVTEFRDQEALTVALCTVAMPHGLPRLTRDEVEIHPDGTNLVGYDTKEARLAHLVVRKRHLGHTLSDIGFRKEANGCFSVIVDDYDMNKGYGEPWLNAVKQQYARALVTRKAHALGYSIKDRQEADGSLSMVLAR